MFSIEEVERQQNKASDPQYSIWTSASAGSGKTTVLVKRLLRMLLNNIEPSKILCITFTNTGAAEMKNRINEKLASWTVMDDGELKKEIIKLDEKDNIEQKLKTARTLFAKILDNSNDFKILTIHSFCQQIIKRFPLEANIVPNFQILDEISSLELLMQAEKELLKSNNEEIKKSIQYIFTYINEDQFIELLKQAINQKDNLLYIKSKFYTIQGIIDELQKIFKIDNKKELENIEDEFYENTDFTIINQGIKDSLNNSDNKFNNKFIKIITEYQKDKDLIYDYINCFLTTDGKITSRLLSKDMQKVFPELHDFILKEAERSYQTKEYINNLTNFEFTSAFLNITYYIFEIYSFLKKQKGCLDYSDLIFETNKLLSNSKFNNLDGENAFSSWINYKLDEGIDHILIDEAQDTSPLQWDIVRSITTEFFSGQGQKGELDRTIFVVGDEKQSIFSFQGAEPDIFNLTLKDYKYKIEQCGKKFDNIFLNTSFRSLKSVLNVVDEVFAEPYRKNAITKLVDKITHKVAREESAGKVEIWPLVEEKDIEQEKTEKVEKNTPLDWQINYTEKIEKSNKQKLAETIANEVYDWFKNGKTICDRKLKCSRKLKYSDIMILVRSRDKDFINYLVRQFNKKHIPTMGNDKFDLLNNIISQDIISLLKFLIFNEDDLVLANIVKSPFLNLDEEDLYTLCDYKNENQCSLWTAFQNIEKYKNQKIFLEDIIEKSKNTSIYELLLYIFEVQNTKKLFKQRFQYIADEILNEFLNLANEYEKTHNNSTILNFISFLENTDLEIKRDMEQKTDEIKILTVHASKGLESPIVILPDTNHTTKTIQRIDEILRYKEEGNDYYIPMIQKEKTILIEEIKDSMKNKIEEEYLRLLYVAMTRAENELYICDYKRKGESKENCWYSILLNTIQNNKDVKIRHSKNIEGDILYIGDQDNYCNILASCNNQQKNYKIEEEKINEIIATFSQNKEKTNEIKIINPSIYYQENAIKTPIQNSENLENGKLVHKLLEILPNLDSGEWQDIIDIYLRNSNNKEKITNIVLNILNNQEFNFLFSKNSKAEVPIFAKIDGNIISGKIDRLSIIDDTVYIVDYKNTNTLYNTIPEKYKIQLNLYKKVLEKIYTDKKIKCYILWTSFGKIEYVS